MRVVIADDAKLMREGTARLLEEAGVQVAGKADDAQKLLRIVATEHPDGDRRHQDAAHPYRRRPGGPAGQGPSMT